MASADLLEFGEPCKSLSFNGETVVIEATSPLSEGCVPARAVKVAGVAVATLALPGRAPLLTSLPAGAAFWTKDGSHLLVTTRRSSVVFTAPKGVIRMGNHAEMEIARKAIRRASRRNGEVWRLRGCSSFVVPDGAKFANFAPSGGLGALRSVGSIEIEDARSVLLPGADASVHYRNFEVRASEGGLYLMRGPLESVDVFPVLPSAVIKWSDRSSKERPRSEKTAKTPAERGCAHCDASNPGNPRSPPRATRDIGPAASAVSQRQTKPETEPIDAQTGRGYSDGHPNGSVVITGTSFGGDVGAGVAVDDDTAAKPPDPAFTPGPCVVCLSRFPNIVFLPCGHMVHCQICDEKCTSAVCSVCRTPIGERHRVYCA